MTTAAPRAIADRCPGLLRPHYAEDGALVRLRVPGGQLDSATLLELSRISAEFGEGSVQLTSRGNLQLRGIDESRLPELVSRVARTGMLPSETHERVRNIVASPLTGLSDDRPDLRPMISDLDAALCSLPELADLPGRFLFALDDGRGDVIALAFDLAFVATGAGAGVVLVGDRAHGIEARTADAVPAMVELARRFLTDRARHARNSWHVRELGFSLADTATIRAVTGPHLPVPLGMIGEAASVAVPLGLLDARQVRAIERAASGGRIVITPWRGVVIPGGAAALDALAETALVTDEESAWSRLTACIGAPSCANSRVSTRELAGELVDHLGAATLQPVHLSGCERRCGAPAGRHVDLVAPDSISRALAEIERSQ